jgi:hypothetical protein
MKGKIIIFGERICLFCGKEKKQHYEEYESYYECDCLDAVKEREIREQIRKLELQIPHEKFEIREEQVLYKVSDK